MIVKDSKGRECEIEISGSDYDDVMVECGTYTDDGSAVPEAELDIIQVIYAGEIGEAWKENAVCAAESYYEGDR